MTAARNDRSSLRETLLGSVRVDGTHGHGRSPSCQWFRPVILGRSAPRLGWERNRGFPSVTSAAAIGKAVENCYTKRAVVSQRSFVARPLCRYHHGQRKMWIPGIARPIGETSLAKPFWVDPSMTCPARAL